MSDEEYSSSYFDDVQEDDSQGEVTAPENQGAPAAEQSQQNFVPVEQFNQLQQQLQELQNNPLKPLGYQKVDQGPQVDPEVLRQTQEFLKSQGVVTQEDLASRERESAAVEHGFVNKHHVESEFDSIYYSTTDQTKIAQLNQIQQMYQVNPRAAIKRFSEFKQGAQQPTPQNQTLGHQPSAQPAKSTPRFESHAEFMNYVNKNPKEGRELMNQWMNDSSGKNNPFPIRR